MCLGAAIENICELGAVIKSKLANGSYILSNNDTVDGGVLESAMFNALQRIGKSNVTGKSAAMKRIFANAFQLLHLREGESAERCTKLKRGFTDCFYAKGNVGDHIFTETPEFL